MTYPEAIKYLESFVNYEKIPTFPYKESFKLERIKDFLAAIDNPHDSLACIHIAGTKGKGSISIFVASILREGGFKVGIYTSPHLSDFRERIRILSHISEVRSQKSEKDFEGMISKDELAGLADKLKPAIEKYNKNSKYGELSFFEVYTAFAFQYFKEKKVDFAVLETGLGGRLDATNVVDSLICAISSISFDHTQKLGNTLLEIAAEKLGVVKNRLENKKPFPQVVISAIQEEEVAQLIKKTAKDRNAYLFTVGRDIFFEEIGYNQNYQLFNIRGIIREYPQLVSYLLGEHQLINAAVAVGIVEGLSFHNLFITPEVIRKGIESAFWPGRFEIVNTNPYIILDGAQNIASARVLKDTVKKLFPQKRVILVLGISQDKDIKGICQELADLADVIILTKADTPRAASPEQISCQLSPRLRSGQAVYNSQIFSAKAVKEAVKLAKDKASKDDIILVTGSLFLVGEAREVILGFASAH